MGSGMGHNGLAGHSACCCAKAALWMLTRVSAHELVPGPVRTDATRDGGAVSGIESEWVKSPEEGCPWGPRRRASASCGVTADLGGPAAHRRPHARQPAGGGVPSHRGPMR